MKYILTIISISVLAVLANYSYVMHEKSMRSINVERYLNRIAQLQGYAQGACFANSKLDGMGQYLHIAQLSGAKNLWGPAFESIKDEKLKSRMPVGIELAPEIFDDATPGKELKLSTMQPCVGRGLVSGYRFKSYLMMGYSDALLPGMNGEIYRQKISNDRDMTWRIRHSVNHYLVTAESEESDDAAYCLTENGIKKYDHKSWMLQESRIISDFSNQELNYK